MNGAWRRGRRILRCAQGDGGLRAERRLRGARRRRGKVHSIRNTLFGYSSFHFLAPPLPGKALRAFPGPPDRTPTEPLDFVGRDDPGAPNHVSVDCFLFRKKMGETVPSLTLRIMRSAGRAESSRPTHRKYHAVRAGGDQPPTRAYHHG